MLASMPGENRERRIRASLYSPHKCVFGWNAHPRCSLALANYKRRAITLRGLGLYVEVLLMKARTAHNQTTEGNTMITQLSPEYHPALIIC